MAQRARDGRESRVRGRRRPPRGRGGGANHAERQERSGGRARGDLARPRALAVPQPRRPRPARPAVHGRRVTGGHGRPPVLPRRRARGVVLRRRRVASKPGVGRVRPGGDGVRVHSCDNTGRPRRRRGGQGGAPEEPRRGRVDRRRHVARGRAAGRVGRILKRDEGGLDRGAGVPPRGQGMGGTRAGVPRGGSHG